MATQFKLETLLTALDAYNRADLAAERDPNAGREMVRAFNRLFDACLDAGMSYEEPDHVAWAAERTTRFLCAA